MSFRSTSKTLFGAAAMVAIGASLATAQSGPTSTRRIPISKEQGGEVTKTDTVTVTVYKTDTLRLTNTVRSTDTLRLTNTVTRVDTVTMAPALRLPNGLYFGVGAGVMAPNGSIYNTNSAGPSAQAQLGWQGAKQIIGLRADVNWAKPGEDSRYAAPQADPDILNFSADAKLQLPFFNHLFGATHRFALYGIGGYTHTMYKNLPIRVLTGGTLPAGGGGVPYVAGSNEWTHKNGWNAGGGASLMWGHTELFVESRVLSFNDTNINQARQMPFMLGINFY